MPDGHDYFLSAWWIATFPGLAIFVVVLGFNLIGDALRDYADPQPPRMSEAAAGSQRPVRSASPDRGGILQVVRDLSFSLQRGETLVIVGESGSGKSVTCLALMGLLPRPAGRVLSGGACGWPARIGTVRDMARLEQRDMQRIRGAEIAMIFQEPMTSLNPVYTIGEQIIEAVQFHESVSPRAARARATEMLALLGIPDPAARLDSYPHELSGGMRQRAMIGMALACRPALLIADEPTTALDVTVQAQILDLLRRLQRELGMAMIFVTHNLGVAGEIADRVLVMYAGQCVEAGAAPCGVRHAAHALHDGAAARGAAARAGPRGGTVGNDTRQRAGPRAPACRLRVSSALRFLPARAVRCARTGAGAVRSERMTCAACAGGTSKPHDRAAAGNPHLSVHFSAGGLLARGRPIRAVDDVSFDIGRGRLSGWLANPAPARPRSATPCCAWSNRPPGDHVRRERCDRAAGTPVETVPPPCAADLPGPVRIARSAHDG